MGGSLGGWSAIVWSWLLGLRASVSARPGHVLGMDQIECRRAQQRSGTFERSRRKSRRGSCPDSLRGAIRVYVQDGTALMERTAHAVKSVPLCEGVMAELLVMTELEMCASMFGSLL